MATPLALRDFALLGCVFEIVAPDDEEDDSREDAEQSERSEEIEGEPRDEAFDAIDADAEASAVLELEGVRLRFSMFDNEDEFTLVVETKLTLEALPYRLRLLTGSRFAKPDPPVTAAAAIQTLLFVSYPYIRETVTSITSRSPYTRFDLPPLIRLPHPSVTGEAAAEAAAGESKIQQARPITTNEP